MDYSNGDKPNYLDVIKNGSNVLKTAINTYRDIYNSYILNQGQLKEQERSIDYFDALGKRVPGWSDASMRAIYEESKAVWAMEHLEFIEPNVFIKSFVLSDLEKQAFRFAVENHIKLFIDPDKPSISLLDRLNQFKQTSHPGDLHRLVQEKEDKHANYDEFLKNKNEALKESMEELKVLRLYEAASPIYVSSSDMLDELFPLPTEYK